MIFCSMGSYLVKEQFFDSQIGCGGMSEKDRMKK
jgi:hypothetical protein